MRGMGVVAVAVASLGLAAPAVAAPGDLDRSFSGDGKQTTDFARGDEGANDLAVQPDGKIVVVGSTSREGSLMPTSP